MDTYEVKTREVRIMEVTYRVEARSADMAIALVQEGMPGCRVHHEHSSAVQIDAEQAKNTRTDETYVPYAKPKSKLTPKEEYEVALLMRANTWVTACGGDEVPFVARNGMRLLYVFNPALQQHGYLNLDTDFLLTPEQEAAALRF